MAKKQNGNNKKQRPSNLKNVIMQNGYNGDINLYLSIRTPLDMQRDAIRSFRDIGMGNIDLEFEGQVFLNPNFIENAIIACQTKCSQALVRSKGEEELLKHPEYGIPAKVIQENLTNDQTTFQAFNIILSTLNNIKITGNLEYINVANTLINQNKLRYNL